MSSRPVVVLVTCPSRPIARRIAFRLVEQRLAACVNIVSGLESVFRWQGKVDQARESLLVIKSTAARFEALKRAILTLHPYDVPEIIALPITAGHRPYVEWVVRSSTTR